MPGMRCLPIFVPKETKKSKCMATYNPSRCKLENNRRIKQNSRESRFCSSCRIQPISQDDGTPFSQASNKSHDWGTLGILWKLGLRSTKQLRLGSNVTPGVQIAFVFGTTEVDSVLPNSKF